MKKIIAFLAFGLILSGPVNARELDAGFESAEKGNYQQTYNKWFTLAERL